MRLLLPSIETSPIIGQGTAFSVKHGPIEYVINEPSGAHLGLDTQFPVTEITLNAEMVEEFVVADSSELGEMIAVLLPETEGNGTTIRRSVVHPP